MLARLEALDGVVTASVDHDGQFLRLEIVNDRSLGEVMVTLGELGYEAVEMHGPMSVDRWYSREGVGDLSREEGRIIAERVVRPFARSRAMVSTMSDRLERAVADSLGGSFASHWIDSGRSRDALVEESIGAAEVTAAALLGVDAARELAIALRLDLDRTAR